MLALLALVFLFVLPSPAQAMTPEQARALLASPVTDSFHYHYSGSDHPVHSGYEPTSQTPQLQQALLDFADELRRNPGGVAGPQEFARANQFKIAYWLSYFLAHDGFASTLELLNGPTAEALPLTRAYLVYARTLPRDLLAAQPTTEQAGERLPRFSEPPLLQTFRLTRFSPGGPRPLTMAEHRLFEHPFDYVSETTIPTLIRLGRSGRIGILETFARSLDHYVYYVMAFASGRSSRYESRREYERSSRGSRPDPWFAAVHAEVGTDAFVGALKRAMMGGDWTERARRNGAAAPLETYLRSDVRSIDDGILRWAALEAPADVRGQMVDWYLELAGLGKDWSNWTRDVPGWKINSFLDLMREAARRRLTESMLSVGHNGPVWDHLIARGLVTSAEANRFIAFARGLQSQRNRIEAAYEAAVVALRARAANPPRTGRWAAVSFGRLGPLERLDLPAEEAQLRARRDRELGLVGAAGMDGLPRPERLRLASTLDLFVDAPRMNVDMDRFRYASDRELEQAIGALEALAPRPASAFTCAAFGG